MSWKVAHACIRGSSHQRTGLPNQDAVQCTVTPGVQGTIAVAVVSDGHGSPRHFRSQIGSSLAVSTVAATLEAFLRESAGGNDHAPFVPEQVRELERKIVNGWLAAVHNDLENAPFNEAELATLEKAEGAESRAAVESSPELAYGATLLAAAATDKVLLYMQLGDGEILSVSAQGTTTRPLPPDDRLIANQTTSLCQPEAWKDFRSSWVTAGPLPSLVLLSTDGYANSFRSDEDFLRIGQDYLEIIREQGISSLTEELPAILTEATQQGSGDDITLAILENDDSAVAAKTPRPLIPPASKSALIEQLKARHSSQQHKLQELAMRVEQTRKDNRRLRLRNTVLFLILAAVAIVLGAFHNRFFSTPPHTALPVGKEPGRKPPPAVPPASAASKQPVDEWLLQVNGRKLTLDQDTHIPPDFIGPKAKPAEDQKDYAEVARDKNAFVLINRSTDRWMEDGHKIVPGDEVRLGEKPLTIVFEVGIKGTVTLAPATSSVDTDESQ